MLHFTYCTDDITILMILILMLIIRLVELDKLRLATRKEEEAAIAAKGGIDPFYLSQHDDGDSGGGGLRSLW